MFRSIGVGWASAHQYNNRQIITLNIFIRLNYNYTKFAFYLRLKYNQIMINQRKKRRAFTLAEVLIAKRNRGKMSLLNFSRMRELKAPFNSFLKQSAFTLAEVLITLGIIGVVASMTIPALMNKTNDQEFQTAFKKVYTELAQNALLLKSNDEDISFLSKQDFADTFSPHLSVINRGAAGDVYADAKYYKSSSIVTMGKTDPSLTLTDGVVLYFDAWGAGASSACVKSSYTGNGQTVDNICATIEINVNGTKPPNMMGRDCFRLWVRQVDDTIVISPMGFKGEFTCAIGNGTGCATSVLNGTPLP